MGLQFSFPSRKESFIVLAVALLFALLTAFFVGFRFEHLLMVAFFLALYFAGADTRKLAIALLPFFLFGISYDWMRVYPNYLVNPIDVEPIYHLEKQLFGIGAAGGPQLIPCEYFAIHHHPVMDFLSGIFYLGWVPLPIGFGLYLYFKKERDIYLRFAMVFLFVNLLGFAGYYIHPAAPPWYVMNYGFDVVMNTPGNTAGLGRFDAMTGIPVFQALYGRNANVFAAVPSLHSAYLLVMFYYVLKRKSGIPLLLVNILFMCGIWFTAVYSGHHYIIDVALGIACALLGIFLFEKGLMKLGCFKAFYLEYYNKIAVQTAKEKA